VRIRGLQIENCKLKIANWQRSLAGIRRSGQSATKRNWLFNFQFSIFILQFAIPFPAFADDSPKYAERGIAAYSAGKYDLARLFFSRALQDAVLKGNEAWIARATLNLVDLELESMDEHEAQRLLDGFTAADRGLASLAVWKRSQLAFLQRRYPAAVTLADSALRLGPPDRAAETSMRLDRLRYLIQGRDPSVWKTDFADVRGRLGRDDKGRAAGLDGAAAMARGDFAAAEAFWQAAMAHYRKSGRLAKVAACLNQIAVCRFSQGRRQEALDANTRAVAVYGELGLALPGLRAQALRLLLVEDDRELAKLREDMDLVGQRLSGFDLQGILDEYSHTLRAPAPGGKSPAPGRNPLDSLR
jgi:tetratricopeptide (TPR) repeat protein